MRPPASLHSSVSERQHHRPMPKTLLTNAQKKGLSIEILSYKQNINRVIICQVLTISKIYSLLLFSGISQCLTAPQKPYHYSVVNQGSQQRQHKQAVLCSDKQLRLQKTKFTQNSALVATKKHDTTQNHNLDGLVLCNDTPKFFQKINLVQS